MSEEQIIQLQEEENKSEINSWNATLEDHDYPITQPWEDENE